MANPNSPFARPTKTGPFAKLEAPQRRARPGVKRRRTPGDSVESCAFFCTQPSEPLSIGHAEPERLIQGATTRWAFVKNVFPIAAGHNIVVPCDDSGPEREFPHQPQQLARETVAELAHLARQSPRCLFYNSMTAGATVPHFHYQELDLTLPSGKIEARPLSAAGWRNLAVLEPWPCAALVFDLVEIDSVWRAVKCLEDHAVPYNVLASGGRMIVVPRSNLGRGDFEADFGPGMPAALELCGGIFVFTDPGKFEKADERVIHHLIARAGVPIEKAIKFLTP